MLTKTITGIPKLWDTRTLSLALGVSESTVERWRSRGTVPLPYVKVGPRRIMYRAEDIAAFLESQLVQ
jgi:hypothetical protein